MVIENAASSSNAAAAPARTDATGSKAAATISSAIGTPMLSGGTAEDGKPNSMSDRRLPDRSTNFATEAVRKIAESMARPTNVTPTIDAIGATSSITVVGVYGRRT